VQDTSLPCLWETPTGCFLKILIHPRSAQDKIEGLQGDALKISVSAPPIEGKANEACLRFLADQFGLSRSQLSLRGGLRSRHKLIAIDGCAIHQILGRLHSLLDRRRQSYSLISDTEETTKSGR